MIKFFVLALISTSVFAHFEIGTYQGHTAAGDLCSVEFKAVTFAHNVRNPLNEQVTVAYNNEDFILGHAAVFNQTSAEIQFDHDHLSGHKGVNGGAKFLSITMKHEEGPASFIFAEHDWKTNTAQKLECLEIKYID